MGSIFQIPDLILALVMTAAVLFAARHCAHMLQLESYQGKQYRKWIDRSAGKSLSGCVVIGILCLIIRAACVPFADILPVAATVLWYAADVVYIALLVRVGIKDRKVQEKKPFAVTARIKRLFVAMGVIALLFAVNFFIHFDLSDSNTFFGTYLLIHLLRYLPGMLLPYLVFAAWGVTLPIENAVKKHFFNDAKRRLAARTDLIKIGITGSFGKTSTKFFLAGILSQRYRTLATPASYNTPMGVTRIIREKLQPEDQVFVAEMGARHVGDIAEMCDLVAPGIGLITSVGKQHLDTFGSYENVIRTKGELLQKLPLEGAAFLNGDNPDCREMFRSCPVQRKFLFGTRPEAGAEELYLRAKDVQVDASGSRFTLVTAGGVEIPCHTLLLGEHNIQNITGAAAVALYLGLTPEEIAAGIASLQPVEHRLQLIPGAVTVIDDAFNANPAGTKAALAVLQTFPGRKIIVTPGMVELGAEEEALNEAFGRDMASKVDVAILVGKKHVEPIRRGLLLENFPESCIVQVDDLSAAQAKLPLYTENGCVVLFENDLPDNYNE